MCGRASAHPLTFRDRVKMDFEGQFRLAPLPRGERAARQINVYTEATIIDYDWNNIPLAKEIGFGPACIWPIEFYAAMGMDVEDISSPHLPCSPSEEGAQDPRPNTWVPNQVWDERNLDIIPTIPLDDILSPKEYHYFFGSSTS